MTVPVTPDDQNRGVQVATPHSGPVNDVKYHHVGTGRTESRFFCDECDGWYGMPHDDHPHELRAGCACRACLTQLGVYPNTGMILTHGEYRDWYVELNMRSRR